MVTQEGGGPASECKTEAGGLLDGDGGGGGSKLGIPNEMEPMGKDG